METSTLLLAAPLLLVALRVIYIFYTHYTSPLRSVPGPFWARWTRLWYFNAVRGASFHKINIALHKKYGPIVRLAPDWYSIDDPSALKTIYGVQTKFTKNEWYTGWGLPNADHTDLFVDRNAKRHGETRKVFQGMYSLSSMVSYEGYVDECADLFEQRLDEMAARGAEVNMGHWFQCLAFDVIGDITYSKRFGFLDRGEDIGGTLAALHKNLIYGALAGIYSNLHPWVYPLVNRGSFLLANFSRDIIKAKEAEKRDPEKAAAAAAAGKPQDFLEKLMIARDKSPERVTPFHLFMMCFSNVIAGSDTTALTISSILYFLLKNPEKLAKLREEVDRYEREGRCSSDKVTFKESQEMPYLQAVIKESTRLHGGTGTPLWRVVPEGGAEISGRFFPAGASVGTNVWVAHQNTEAFGPDADQFRPERWLDASPEELKRMESNYLAFGAGARTCIGKNIAFLEIQKVMPRLVKRYDFVLRSPNRDWRVDNYWFCIPKDFYARVVLRSPEAKV